MTVFFGDRWDAPIVDPPATQMATPVGEPCYSCQESIVPGDQGVARTMIGADAVASLGFIHRECDLLGAVGHMVGCCSCVSWSGTRRELARECERRWALGVLISTDHRGDIR